MTSKKNLQETVSKLKSRINSNNILESLLEIIAEINSKVENLEKAIVKMKLRDILLPMSQERYKGLTSLKIDASYPLSSYQGFYALEYDSNGLPYRWTGPEPTFFFDLHLDRTLPLKFNLILYLKSPEQQRIRCFSDEVEIPLQSNEIEPNFWKFSGILFPREIIGLTRVMFVVPKVYKAEDPDTRILGVVFKEFSINPASEEEIENYLEKRVDA